MKEKVWAYSCEDKFKFKSEKAARKAIHVKGKKLSPYLCKNCHYWHVGNHIGKGR